MGPWSLNGIIVICLSAITISCWAITWCLMDILEELKKKV